MREEVWRDLSGGGELAEEGRGDASDGDTVLGDGISEGGDGGGDDRDALDA